MKNEVYNNMMKNEKNLSKYASKNEDAIRFFEQNKDFRTEYFRDVDKILYSLSYVRYVDKTQVFSNIDNDMISKRIIHVQLVSKIARTIGRALNLNEDLIEAAGLGHDLGHVPFGHTGEKILNELSLKYNQGLFYHNVQSVRTLMNIENNGNGNNITIQVLDAILCHNGEKLQQIYSPCIKSKDDFLREYSLCYKDSQFVNNLVPMTLEGCVVKISDIIAYIGKDVEDAIRLNKVRIEDIPKNVINTLGLNNSDIINTIVIDIINNSINKNYIKLSKKIYDAMLELIEFNYNNIYFKANTDTQVKQYEIMFNKLFNLYYNQIINNEVNEDIYVIFLSEMTDEYKNNTLPARIVIDYIAGMTDDFLVNQYHKYFC